jgi:hypothetical protein
MQSSSRLTGNEDQLAGSAMQLPADVRVAVLVNGQPVLDEIASRGGDRTSWSRTVELLDFGEEAWLNMEVHSTYAAPDDTRPLGVRLLALSLER